MTKGKWIGIILIIGLILGGFFIIRGCTKLTEKKTFLIARDNSWYPFNLLGKSTNLVGLTDDLLATIGKVEGIQFHIISTTADSLITGLDNEIYDGIMSFMPDNATNRQYYTLSDPFFLTGPVLVVNQNDFPPSKIVTLMDMKGKDVGIPSTASAFFDKESNVIFFKPYDNMTRALEDLSRSQIDGVIMNSIPAYNYTKGLYRGTLRIATPPFTVEGLRIITLSNHQGESLVEHFNHGLKVLKEKGVYDELMQKWELFNSEPAKTP